MYTNISWMSLWGIDPKAFLRSTKVAQRGRPFSFALSMIAFTVKMCSWTPDIPDRKPFCSLGSMILFCRTYVSIREARIRWNNLPTAEVKVMGLKFSGCFGFPFLCISQIFPMHHNLGACWDLSRIIEKRVARKW